MSDNHDIDIDQAARIFRSVFGTATYEARQNVVDAVDRYANELERERAEVPESVDAGSFEFLNELALAFRSGEKHARPQHTPVLEGIRAVLAHLHSAGRLIPAGGMALTAEQVEDVKIVLGQLERGGPAFEAAHERLRALFPATEPAEDSVGDPLQAWKEFLKPKPIGWYRTMTPQFATKHFGFPGVIGSKGFWTHTTSDGGKWAWDGDDWELREYPPTPAEPAEEETKAEPSTRQISDVIVEGRSQNMSWMQIAEMVKQVFFPTETGPWQRIEDVPETVGRLTDRDGDIWEWDGDNWVTPETAILPTAYINKHFAPFVAAAEGS